MHARRASLWACNLIVPGSGLIFLHREWLGFCLAIIFSISANATITGALIAPLAWPRWLVILSAVVTVLSWALGQALCLLQWKAAKSCGLSRIEVVTTAEFRAGVIHRA